MVARADSLTITQPYAVGRGTVEEFSIAAPGAQTNLSRTTAQGYWERYISLFVILTTDANAANRVLALEFQDGDGNVVGGTTNGVLQTATNTFRYYFMLGGGITTAAASARQLAPLPYLFVQPSWKLVSNVAAFQVGDTLTAIRGVVERFGIGPDGTPIGETATEYTERGRGYDRALESE